MGTRALGELAGSRARAEHKMSLGYLVTPEGRECSEKGGNVKRTQKPASRGNLLAKSETI